jgi:tetratricopeptide (TPR) repeat protein
VNRAAAYTKLEEFELAIEDCEKGIEVDPLYSKAYARMGTCYYLQEKFSEASSAYKKALELQPDNVSYAQNVRMSENRIPKVASTFKILNSDLSKVYNNSFLYDLYSLLLIILILE